MNLGYVSFKNILYISPQYTLTKNRPFGIKYFGQGLQVSYIVWNYNFFWDNVRLIFRIIFFEREKKNASALEGRFGCKACILHYLYNL